MKLTKKAAALLLAASLAVSVCAMPVFATDASHGAEIKKEDTTGSSSQTEVKYEVTEGYTWAIPATIDFGSNAGVKKTRTVDANQEKNGNYKKAETNIHGSSGNVYVADCKLKPGTKLTISISDTIDKYDEGGFYVETTNADTAKTAKVHYAIYKDTVADPTTPTTSRLEKSSEILTLKAGKDNDKQNLTFILSTGDAEIAGEYTGTVAFAAAVTTDATA